MNSLLLMKTTLPWYNSLQLLPSYIYDPWLEGTFDEMFEHLDNTTINKRQADDDNDEPSK